jgi:AraC-like DNA-binding protein
MKLDPHDVRIPDGIAFPIAGLGVELEEGTSTDVHAHRQGELLYSISGQLSVETETDFWMVPSSCALWIPSGTPHVSRSRGPARAGCVFIEKWAYSSLSTSCGLVLVEPLLREMILRLLRIGLSEKDIARSTRLAAVVSDELVIAPDLSLDLPRPRDPRLIELLDAVIEAPSRAISVSQWASRTGACERTLNRLFRRETGMSFVRWRQRLHVRLALQQLAASRPVGAIAYELGYNSTSAFIAKFKEVTGVTPKRYYSLTRNLH